MNIVFVLYYCTLWRLPIFDYRVSSIQILEQFARAVSTRKVRTRSEGPVKVLEVGPQDWARTGLSRWLPGSKRFGVLACLVGFILSSPLCVRMQ